MIKQIILFLIFFVNYFATFEACSCREFDSWEERSKTIYCSVDLIADAFVLNVKKSDDLHYEATVNYTKVYKMPPQFNELLPTKIYSSQQDSACGFRISTGGPFILVGSINGYHGPSGPEGTIGMNYCAFLDTRFEEQLRNGTQVECAE